MLKLYARMFDRDDMYAAIDEAKSIIDKLPRDAKGNPVVPCVDKVWIVVRVGESWWLNGIAMVEPGFHEMGTRGHHNGGVWELRKDDWDRNELWDGPVYLYREDAEKEMGDNQ